MPKYSVVSKNSEYEIRAYEPYVIAETPRTSQQGSSGFGELFRYISGSNTGQSKLAMTAPVLKSSAAAGQQLAMTAPVLIKSEPAGATISFVMPPGSRLAELPRPMSSKITLREIPGHRAAVVRFSGSAGSDAVRRRTGRLLGALERDGVLILSAPTTALYNPPWTPPFMRRNEIQVGIK